VCYSDAGTAIYDDGHLVGQMADGGVQLGNAVLMTCVGSGR
jgi:hypothetical protein